MSMEAARNGSDIGSERRRAKDDMTKNPAIVPSRKPCAFPVSWTARVMGAFRLFNIFRVDSTCGARTRGRAEITRWLWRCGSRPLWS